MVGGDVYQPCECEAIDTTVLADSEGYTVYVTNTFNTMNGRTYYMRKRKMVILQSYRCLGFDNL